MNLGFPSSEIHVTIFGDQKIVYILVNTIFHEIYKLKYIIVCKIVKSLFILKSDL